MKAKDLIKEFLCKGQYNDEEMWILMNAHDQLMKLHNRQNASKTNTEVPRTKQSIWGSIKRWITTKTG